LKTCGILGFLNRFIEDTLILCSMLIDATVDKIFYSNDEVELYGGILVS